MEPPASGTMEADSKLPWDNVQQRRVAKKRGSADHSAPLEDTNLVVDPLHQAEADLVLRVAV
jgi:hypothetical protein